MIEAPTCTVGPSRPIEAPLRSPISVSKTLPKLTRNESTREIFARSVICSAAIT